MTLQNTGDPRAITVPQYISVRLFRLSAGLRRKVRNAGDIAAYVNWLAEVFGKVRPLPTRNKLWELMAQRTRRPVHGIEFGVAYGYATEWWLKRLPGDGVQWDGFDRFTGLPRPWRDLGAGTFDADGQPPAIEDKRVTWHIGEVEDELPGLVLDGSEPCQLVVLFDLDIFEPSLAAWEYLRDSLRPGDLLCFDEAFDADEQRLLNEYILPAGTYDCVGATPTQLGLQVVRMKSGA